MGAYICPLCGVQDFMCDHDPLEEGDEVVVDAGAPAAFSRLASLEAFAEAVKPLVREVGGNLGAFEWAMRESIGNTNYACLKDKHAAADAALAKLEGKE